MTLDWGTCDHRDLLRRHNPHLPAYCFDGAAAPSTASSAGNAIDLPNLDAPIFRVLPLGRLLSSLRDQQITLTRVRCWPDPFENWLLRGRGRMASGELVSLSNIFESYFGQCWTLNEDSDAMWRIYSADEEGIKVRTTVRKLFAAFYDSANPTVSVSDFVGLVRYLPQEQIERLMTGDGIAPRLLFDNTGVMQTRVLLTKRFEFSHEAEVRLIRSLDRSHPQFANDYPPFRVDTNAVFDELMIDPRCKPLRVREITTAIQDAGYSNAVGQSSLYNPPNWEFAIPDDSLPGPLDERVWNALTTAPRPRP